MESLESIRKKINEIDQQMAKLFEERMDCAAGVIEYKLRTGMPILDVGREQEIIENCPSRLVNADYGPYYKEFMVTLIDLSKKLQYALSNQNTAGYQGAMGAFSHIAAANLFPQLELKSFSTFEEVFIAVENGDIAYGVLPFENSSTGEVGEVYDLLMKYNCFIVQCYNLKVSQNLIGLKGSKLNDIKEIYSHQQAISQCQGFLRGIDAEVFPYTNTALAAKYISEANDLSKAAIASSETAQIYDLEILAENINTNAQNTTRFIVISKKKSDNGDRFSMFFTVKHAPGQLAKIIQIIADYGYNMDNIRSRPKKDVPWEYYFYVEMDGNTGQEKTKQLINAIKENTEEIKILGSYELLSL